MSTTINPDVRDTILITALAGGASPAQAAAGTGVSEHELVWRLTDAAFRRRVHQARVELARAAAHSCTDLAETLAAVELPEELAAYTGATLERVSSILSHLADVIGEAGPGPGSQRF
jgi:hypothetical protein